MTEAYRTNDQKEICSTCSGRGTIGSAIRFSCPECSGQGTRPEGSRESQERSQCSACKNKTLHTPSDWKHHTLSGHGYTKEHGYSHPLLEPPGQIVDRPKDVLLKEYPDRKGTAQ